MQSQQSDPGVTGLVLGTGGSSRLEHSKQLLTCHEGRGHPIWQAGPEVSAGVGGPAQTLA